jgi:hypothetical protein
MRRHHWEEVRRGLARASGQAEEARRTLERDLDERSGGALSRLMTPRQAQLLDVQLARAVDVAALEREVAGEA